MFNKHCLLACAGKQSITPTHWLTVAWVQQKDFDGYGMGQVYNGPGAAANPIVGSLTPNLSSDNFGVNSIGEVTELMQQVGYSTSDDYWYMFLCAEFLGDGAIRATSVQIQRCDNGETVVLDKLVSTYSLWVLSEAGIKYFFTKEDVGKTIPLRITVTEFETGSGRGD